MGRSMKSLNWCFYEEALLEGYGWPGQGTLPAGLELCRPTICPTCRTHDRPQCRDGTDECEHCKPDEQEETGPNFMRNDMTHVRSLFMLAV
jgi:hypothetical protein